MTCGLIGLKAQSSWLGALPWYKNGSYNIVELNDVVIKVCHGSHYCHSKIH